MKRREFLKLVGGSTLTLVPAVGSWVSAGTVEEVDDVMVESSISVDDIKRAIDIRKKLIDCLNKNKCQPIQPMGGYVFYADPDLVIAANKVGKTGGLASELFADSFICVCACIVRSVAMWRCHCWCASPDGSVPARPTAPPQASTEPEHCRGIRQCSC